MEPRRLGGLHLQLGIRIPRAQRPEVDKCDTMVLVVIRHEREARVFVDNMTAEDGAVPVTEFFEPIGLEHDVRELGGRHDESSFGARSRPSGPAVSREFDVERNRSYRRALQTEIREVDHKTATLRPFCPRRSSTTLTPSS